MYKETNTIFANSEEIKSLIGINFALNGQHGMNCYGAVRKVYDHLNIKLPNRDALILNKEYIEAEGSNWIRIDKPEHLCVAIIDHGHTLHLGIVLLEKEGSKTFKLLHALPNKGVVCADLKRYEKRIIAFARYKEGEGDFTLPEAQGGDTGRAIGGLLIAVMASVIPGAGFLALTGFQAAFASIAISVIGSVLLNKFCPLKQPEVPQISGFSGELQESKTYTFSGISNVRNQGNIKPILIGTMRTGGQIVTETIWADINSDEYYDVLLTPVKGLISHVGTTYLNDTALQYYPSTQSALRFGADEQPVIPYFGTIYTSFSQSVLIPQARNTLEKDSNALVVNVKNPLCDSYFMELAAPSGCYYLDDTNEPQAKNVKIGCEYYNGATWQTPEIATVGQFSAAIERTSGIFATSWPYLLYDPSPGGNASAMNFAERIKKEQNFEIYNNTITTYCTEDADSLPLISWAASLLVNYQTRVKTNTGHYFIKINSGSSLTGGTEPDWESYLETGAQVTDGAVVWAEISACLLFKAYTDSARTIVAYPALVFVNGVYQIQSGDIDVFTASGYGVPPGAINTIYFKTRIASATIAPCKVRFTVQLCGAISAAEDYYYGLVKIWGRTTAPPNLWNYVDFVTVGSEDVTTEFFGIRNYYIEALIGEFSFDTCIAVDFNFLGSGASTNSNNSVQIKDIEVVQINTGITDFNISGDANNPTKALNKTFYIDNSMVLTIEKWRFFRTTPGTATQYTQDQIYLKYYGEGFSSNFEFTYPNHALVGLRVKATDRLSGSQPEISAVLTGAPLALPASGNRTDTTVNALYEMTTPRAPLWIPLNPGTIVRGINVDYTTRIKIMNSITSPSDLPGAQTRGFIVLTDATYPGYAGTDQLLTKPFFRIKSWEDFGTHTYLYVEADFSLFTIGEAVTIFTHANAPVDNFAWAIAKMLIEGSTGKITENMINWSTFNTWNVWNELTTSWMALAPETRNKLNCVIDYQADLWSTVQQTALYARAFIVPSNGQYKAVVDKEDSIVQIFSDGNCSNVDWDFIPKRDRANVIIATFKNEENDYEDKTVSAEDIQGSEVPNIANIGMMVGVTKESQVQRHLNYILLQNRYITSTINFDTGPQNIEMETGDVFGFQSKVLNNHIGGRLTFDDDSVTEDATTKVLIHADGVGGYTGIQDDCGNVFTESPIGSTEYSHINYKFGNSSILGTNFGFIKCPNSADFFVDTNDFCIDFWMHYLTTSDYVVYYQHYEDGNNFAQFAFHAGLSRFYFTVKSASVQQAQYTYDFGAFTTNTWYHIALTWDGATLRLFINGTAVVWTTTPTAYTGTWGYVDSTLILFQNASDQVYIDEFRFVNGAAKYTSNFTPSTEPYKVNSVTLDQDIVPEDNETYSLKIWDSTGDIREWQSKIGQPTSTLPAPTGFVTTGRYECAYKIAIVGSAYTEFRCLAIKRKTKSFMASINGIEYRTEVYPND